MLAQLAGDLPLDTINAVANTVTAVAVLWAARSLRRSLTDVRLLRVHPPFSYSSTPYSGERGRTEEVGDDEGQAEDRDTP